MDPAPFQDNRTQLPSRAGGTDPFAIPGKAGHGCLEHEGLPSPQHSPLGDTCPPGADAGQKTHAESPEIEKFLTDYEQRAATLLERHYSKHPTKHPTITAKMFSDGAREVLQSYKDVNRVVPVEIALAQLILEGGLSGTERTKGNLFNVGETDSGGHINKGGTPISYEDGFKTYYHLIAKRYLAQKSPEQLLQMGSFTNGKGTTGGAYAANPMYESLLKAQIGKMFLADSELKLSGSVGKGGKNHPADVMLVGNLLVQAGFLHAADAASAEKVTEAIGRFQQQAILPDEESDWYGHRISAIKGRGHEALPDDSSKLSTAAQKSMRDINTQKSWFRGSLIAPGDQTLGILCYMGKAGKKFASFGPEASPADAANKQAPPQQPAGDTESPQHGLVTVKARALNVRAGPSLTAAKLAVLPAGATAMVVGKQGGWYHIEHRGGRGFLSGVTKYVEFQPLPRSQNESPQAGPSHAAGLVGAIEDLADDARESMRGLFDWLCEPLGAQDSKEPPPAQGSGMPAKTHSPALGTPPPATKVAPGSEPAAQTAGESPGAAPRPPLAHRSTDGPQPGSSAPRRARQTKTEAPAGAVSGTMTQHLRDALGHFAESAAEGSADSAHGPLQPRESSAPGTLDQLLARDRLSPEQIDQARQQIAALPTAERAHYYLLLQNKPEYQNQRDNPTKKENIKGGTCNLTSVAMCLEYLGVPNPKPKLQYDEALCELAEESGWHDLTAHSTWENVAHKLGVQMKTVSSGGKVPRARWESEVRSSHLAAGQSVLCSISGHVVRVQAVTDRGLIVDDPYGSEHLKAGTKHQFTAVNRGKSKDGAAKHAENEGEDNTWPWENVEAHTFGWIYAFAR